MKDPVLDGSRVQRPPRVAMLVRNDLAHDARVRRCATALAHRGFEVAVVGTCRDDAGSRRRSDDGYEVILVPVPGMIGSAPARARDAARAAKAALRDAERRARCIGKQERGSAARVAGALCLEWLARQRHATASRRFRRLRELAKAAPERYRAAWWPVLERLQPDIVHVHDYHGMQAATWAARTGAQWIYDAHEDSAGQVDRSFLRRALVGNIQRHARSADGVITVSRALAERLRARYGLRQRIVLVHNAPSRKSSPTPQPGLRSRIGIGPRTPLLVYAGIAGRKRRLETVIEALARLEGVRLALVTPRGPRVEELLRLADERGVASRVHWSPPVPPHQVTALIAEADVGVHPLARYPNGDIAFPNKLFEYMHAGLPMVVSDSPQMAGFVRRHELGEVAAVGDVEGWGRAIERTLAHPERYVSDSPGREKLLARWSWETQEEALVELYERLLSRRKEGLRSAS